MVTAVNDAGDVVVLGQDGAWTPAPRARNPDTGAEVYHDGQDWQPMPKAAAAPPPRDPMAAFQPPDLDVTADPAAAQPAQPGTGSGMGRGLGLGTRATAKGVLGPAAMLYDLAAIPQNAINAGVKAVTGRDLGISTRSGGDYLEAGLDATGLPQPRTLGEQRAARLVEGMAGVIPAFAGGAALQAARPASAMAQAAGRMLTSSPVAQVVSGAGAGAGAQTAEEMGAGPLGETLAGLAGGGLAGAGAHVAGAGLRAVGAGLMPLTQGGREAIAADALLQRSRNPVGTRGELLAARLDPNARLPDSPATTAQVTGDRGLAALEADLRTGRGQPQGSPDAAPRFAALDAQRNAARMAELPPPVSEAAATQGNQLRGTLDEAKQQRQAGTGAMHDAIDPEGTSRVPMVGVQQAMQDLQGKYYGPMSGGLPPDLARIAGELAGPAAIMPYGHAQNLRSRLTALQDKFGGDNRAQAVITQLKASIDAAAEAAARPQEPASMPQTAADLTRQAAQEGATQRPDVAEALVANAGPARAQAANDTTRAAVSSGGQALGAGGQGGLASFIFRNGGVRDDGGEIMQALGGTTRTRPGLLNSKGVPLDRMREMAHQEGYIGRPGQDVNGAGGTTMDDLVQALQDELHGPRQAPGRASGDRTLVQHVDQELDSRGLSINDPPDQVLSAVRDPGYGTAPSGPAPDGYAPIADGFTPGQADRRQQALAMSRQQGQDFGRDTTGTGAVPTILQRGEGGGWNVPDQQVIAHALSSPNAARQVLRAGGPDTLPTLRQSFIDQAHQASSSGVPDVAGNPMLQEPGWRRFWQENRDTAAVLFPPEQMQRLELLSRDFAETASTKAAGMAAGGDTPRSLSVANLISQASRGMIDPGNVAAQSALRFPGWLMNLGERGIRTLLADASADPQLAARLMERASPEAVERAVAYMSQSGRERIGQAAGDATGQLAIRAGQAGAGAIPDPDHQRRARMIERLGIPVDAPREKQMEMARRLHAPMIATGQ